jgi:hypothetical protein
MSFKTDRLVKLFPDVYAATETESILFKLLDAVAAELVVADESIKQMLKSHWIDYAQGPALDGLGAVFGVSRRKLVDETIEPDEAFRNRLKSIVPLYTGGGTRTAVIGAVRSALGLPFDLNRTNLPAALREDLEALIFIEEFSPTGERLLGQSVVETHDSETTLAPCHSDGTNEIRIVIDIPAVQDQTPRIRWQFKRGVARCLSVELLPEAQNTASVGFRSGPELLIHQTVAGATLTIEPRPDGSFGALLDNHDVTSFFTDLDGNQPPRLPKVPLRRSEWRFRAQSAMFDTARFDDETFDLPLFEVEMSWVRHQPLTFDVHIPYFMKKTVNALAATHGYTGPLLVFEGLPLETVVDVVEQTAAAGVRARVQFTLNIVGTHDHQQQERFRLDDQFTCHEDAAAKEGLVVSSLNDIGEQHDTGEAFAIGGIFDVSRFDGGHGFGP